MKLSKVSVLAPIFGTIVLVGCSPATDVSKQPTEAEISAAKARSASAVDERKDLTPAQREGLKRYYNGGQNSGRSGPPPTSGG